MRIVRNTKDKVKNYHRRLKKSLYVYVSLFRKSSSVSLSICNCTVTMLGRCIELILVADEFLGLSDTHIETMSYLPSR